jgi:hypothetical protein
VKRRASGAVAEIVVHPAITTAGTEIVRIAQIVEILLEHQSILSSECLDLIALALKNEGIFKSCLPSSPSSASLLSGFGTRTVRTICGLAMAPLFCNSLAGLKVQHWTPVLRSARQPGAIPPENKRVIGRIAQAKFYLLSDFEGVVDQTIHASRLPA